MQLELPLSRPGEYVLVCVDSSHRHLTNGKTYYGRKVWEGNYYFSVMNDIGTLESFYLKRFEIICHAT